VVHERAQRELEWKLDINHSRFERLWRKAHREGERAMRATKESPGWCIVHVRIPDGLFAFWLVKTGKAKYSGGVRVFISCQDIYDCNRQEAYAEAFMRVLIAAGIDAHVESRLD
jgi:hypothetical protein